MKIALLSFHNAANYGAAMQAYALQRFLESKGYDCEYLRYENLHRQNAYSMSSHIIESIKRGKLVETVKFILGTPFLELRKFKFNQFYKEHLKVSARRYTNSEEASQSEIVYDKFIVGSDQVWCPENNGSDTAFLLSFVKDSRKKISYSSSFGLAEIPDHLKDAYKKSLLDIPCLSTRERFGCRLIKELTGRDAVQVLDPVFLLSAEEWSRLIPERIHERFFFSYTNRNNQLSSFISQTQYPLSGKRLYKLSRQTSVSDFINPRIKVQYTMKPEQFIQSVRDAEFVVTASFHCLAFSIIFHKPFICILTGNQGKDERIVGLLKDLGLTNRILQTDTTLGSINNPIDWDKVEQLKEVKLKESVDFINSALSF